MLRQIEDEVLSYGPDLIVLDIVVPFFYAVTYRSMYRGISLNWATRT